MIICNKNITVSFLFVFPIPPPPIIPAPLLIIYWKNSNTPIILTLPRPPFPHHQLFGTPEYQNK